MYSQLYAFVYECNRSFRQRYFRKRLCSIRKRVEVSSRTFRSQFANALNITCQTGINDLYDSEYYITDTLYA